MLTSAIHEYRVEVPNSAGIDISGKQLGNPEKGAEVIVDVIRGEGVAAGKKIPPYVALGSDTYRIENDILDSSKKILEEWKDVAYSTDFQD